MPRGPRYNVGNAITAVDTDPELAAPPTCIACTVDAECDDGDVCNGVERLRLGLEGALRASSNPQ